MEIFGGIIVLSIMVLLSGIKVVKDNNRLVVYRMGRVVATKGAGVHLIVPILESAETVDTRMMMLDTPLLTVTTLDNQSVNISAACMFQIGDAKKAVTKISNAPDATLTMAQTVLRTVTSQNDLRTLQAEQKGINKRLKTALEKHTREWGINIKSMEIRTIALVEAPIAKSTIANQAIANQAVAQQAVAAEAPAKVEAEAEAQPQA